MTDSRTLRARAEMPSSHYRTILLRGLETMLARIFKKV